MSPDITGTQTSAAASLVERIRHGGETEAILLLALQDLYRNKHLSSLRPPPTTHRRSGLNNDHRGRQTEGTEG